MTVHFESDVKVLKREIDATFKNLKIRVSKTQNHFLEMEPTVDVMDDQERGVWLKQLSAAVEAKSFLSKAASLRSFRAYDVAETAPKEYICPISLELMRDPVLLVESGQVYDRSSIEGWFKSGKSTCPVSGQKHYLYSTPDPLL